MKTFGVAIEILGKCGYTMKCGIGDFASYLGIMEQGKDTATFRKFGSGKDSLAESGVQELIVVDATTAQASVTLGRVVFESASAAPVTPGVRGKMSTPGVVKSARWS